jgi:preprotein translocase subunit YajC
LSRATGAPAPIRVYVSRDAKETALTLPHLLAQTQTSTTVPVSGTMTTAPAGAPTTQSSPPFWGSPFFVPLILLGVFLFLSSRSKKNQERKVQDMLGNLKRGDRVQTIGGIIGTVVEARENEVLVKVDETNNTKIRFSRKAIHRVLEDDTAAAADKDKK